MSSPQIKPVRLGRSLERLGYVILRQKGSHRVYGKGDIKVTVPIHNKELKKKTLIAIQKQPV